jgi:hypothetical protein
VALANDVGNESRRPDPNSPVMMSEDWRRPARSHSSSSPFGKGKQSQKDHGYPGGTYIAAYVYVIYLPIPLGIFTRSQVETYSLRHLSRALISESMRMDSFTL